MTGTARLGNDALELVDLLLGTTESSELVSRVSKGDVLSIRGLACAGKVSYPLLGELASTLVLGVAEQFNHTLLVGSEAIAHQTWSACFLHHQIRSCPSIETLDERRGKEGKEREKKTHPATSLTTSRTNAVRLLRWPLVRETRGLTTRGVVFYIPRKNIREKVSLLVRPSSATNSRDPPRGETGLVLFCV